MKFLVFLLILLMSFLCFGAIPEFIAPRTLDWNDNAGTDTAYYTVFCSPEGVELTFGSPHVDSNISELSLNDQSTRDALEMITYGVVYQLCVTASNSYGDRSTCSAVMLYPFTMRAPPVPTGLGIVLR